MQSCHGILTGNTDQPTSRTGKLVFVLGVRGGVGATTVAVATAWYLAEKLKRRVALMDLDLQFGDAALQLDAAPSHALREALDHPERVDELFLERGMTRIGERLGVLAALEPLDGKPDSWRTCRSLAARASPAPLSLCIRRYSRECFGRSDAGTAPAGDDAAGQHRSARMRP